MNYSKINNEDITFLESLCGKDKVFTADRINEDFSHDELSGISQYPEVLVEVSSTEEVSKIMKYAVKRNIPVTPRGQGTGLVGGSVAFYGGIMMNMSSMNKILELDEENLTLTVEPGVLLMEISKFVKNMIFSTPLTREKKARLSAAISIQMPEVCAR